VLDGVVMFRVGVCDKLLKFDADPRAMQLRRMQGLGHGGAPRLSGDPTFRQLSQSHHRLSLPPFHGTHSLCFPFHLMQMGLCREGSGASCIRVLHLGFLGPA